jgi:hypothetical protein
MMTLPRWPSIQKNNPKAAQYLACPLLWHATRSDLELIDDSRFSASTLPGFNALMLQVIPPETRDFSTL